MSLLPLLGACTITTVVGAECLRLSEVMPTPLDDELSVLANADFVDTGVLRDTLEQAPDWLEVCNASDRWVEGGWYALTNNDGEIAEAPDPWQIPDGRIAGGECRVVIAEPECVDAGCASFDLQRELGGFVQLSHVCPETDPRCEPDTDCLDQLTYPEVQKGSSMVRRGDRWEVSNTPTPGVSEW